MPTRTRGSVVVVAALTLSVALSACRDAGDTEVRGVALERDADGSPAPVVGRDHTGATGAATPTHEPTEGGGSVPAATPASTPSAPATDDAAASAARDPVTPSPSPPFVLGAVAVTSPNSWSADAASGTWTETSSTVLERGAPAPVLEVVLEDHGDDDPTSRDAVCVPWLQAPSDRDLVAVGRVTVRLRAGDEVLRTALVDLDVVLAAGRRLDLPLARLTTIAVADGYQGIHCEATFAPA